MDCHTDLLTAILYEIKMSVFPIYCNEKHHNEFLKYQACYAMLRKEKNSSPWAARWRQKFGSLLWRILTTLHLLSVIFLPLSIEQKYFISLYVPTPKCSKHIYEQKFYLLTFHTFCYIYHKLQEETKCVHSINFGKFQQKNQYFFSQGF